jgi:glycosyltransferase involved in cell wall biosynthesis
MEKLSKPDFSRFKINIDKGAPLPIFPLTFPKNDRVGVVLVSNHVAQDTVHYATERLSSFRRRWLILATTQSDAVPTDCSDVDFNFFTNVSGVSRYLSSPARHVPFSTELGDGHYIDPNVFYPDPNISKVWDIVYPAKWYPTKRTELILEAARLDPNLRVAIYGWPVVSERKIEESKAYREIITRTASELPNVEVFDSGFQEDEHYHHNSDGTMVIGRLTKDQMREYFFQKVRASVFLSETTEAVNKVCTEMLCCDVPMLVAPTNGGLERLVTSRTGVMIERSPRGILEGLQYVIGNKGQFSPRSAFLETYGKENANRKLKSLIESVAKNKGVEVNWENFHSCEGDLWTPPNIYLQVLKS